MKLFAQAILTGVIVFCLTIFLFFNYCENKNREQIIETSNRAIIEEEFEEWVFSDATKIEELTVILSKDIKNIFLNSPKEITKIKTNKTTGQLDTAIVINKSICRSFFIKKDIIENTKTIKSTQQNLESLIPFLENRKLDRVSICRDKKSVSLSIPKKKNPYISDYYVRHSIKRNDPKVDNLKINNTFDVLRKSKTISTKLEYVIEIIPYNGI